VLSDRLAALNEAQAGTVLASSRISVPHRYSILILAIGLAAGSVRAQAVIEGTILVLATPYFQKTDTAGRYRREHLPAGNYVSMRYARPLANFSMPRNAHILV
jgi:hypothetical protein